MEANEKLREIGRLLRSQDNRCTSDPIFAVQQKRRLYGFDTDYTDDYVWIDVENGHVEASDVEAAGLDAIESNGGEIPDEWVKTGYVDQWEFVTCCFTEQGAKDYIEANGHNLNQPRIYVYSAYRNREFITVREWLKGT